MADSSPCTLLVDNGSHRAESTLSLRGLAAALAAELGQVVHPVSLLHSTRVAARELGGVPAEIVEPFLKKQRAAGVHSFLVVPLFFGRSSAIYEYLPQRVRALREQWPELELRVAPSLVDLSDPNDTGVAEVLAELVRKKMAEEQLTRPAVTLVDHGTPRKAVNEVRNFLAVQLGHLLRDEASAVVASSMERREGEAYSFNEPLLENLLGSEGFTKEVVLSMLFLSPGRHAGPGGDIAEICEVAEQGRSGLRTFRGDLFATHPALPALLAHRFRQGLAEEPVRENNGLPKGAGTQGPE